MLVFFFCYSECDISIYYDFNLFRFAFIIYNCVFFFFQKSSWCSDQSHFFSWFSWAFFCFCFCFSFFNVCPSYTPVRKWKKKWGKMSFCRLLTLACSAFYFSTLFPCVHGISSALFSTLHFVWSHRLPFFFFVSCVCVAGLPLLMQWHERKGGRGACALDFHRSPRELTLLRQHVFNSWSEKQEKQQQKNGKGTLCCSGKLPSLYPPLRSPLFFFPYSSFSFPIHSFVLSFFFYCLEQFPASF